MQIKHLYLFDIDYIILPYNITEAHWDQNVGNANTREVYNIDPYNPMGH